MWPLTIIPPRFAEGYIVTLVDKYCATKEFFRFLKTRKNIKLLSEGKIEKNAK